MRKKSKSVGHEKCGTSGFSANRRGDHEIIDSHQARVAINNADHKPRKNKRGQAPRENQRVQASSGQATDILKPNSLMPDHQLERDHSCIETHRKNISLRPVSQNVKSRDEIQDDSFVNLGAHDAHNIHGCDVNDAGYDNRETQSSSASDNLSNGHSLYESHAGDAVTGDDHIDSDPQMDSVIPTIRELWKNRQVWHRAEKSLTLQGKAQCRRFTGGDKTEANKLFASLEKMVAGDQIPSDTLSERIATAISPFIEARIPLEAHRKLIEKELVKLAKSLPIHPWTQEIQGFGPLSLAAIVGCAGDLNNYSTVSKLWKRMGLAVLNGVRQRKMKDAIAALEHGFAPERAAVMFNIGGGLIGGMGHGPRPKIGEDVSQREDLSVYQKRFIELIRKEVTRVTETWNGPEHQRDPVEKKGELYESYSSHAANRIRRRIGKEFLCDLQVAWKGAVTQERIAITGCGPLRNCSTQDLSVRSQLI